MRSSRGRWRQSWVRAPGCVDDSDDLEGRMAILPEIRGSLKIRSEPDPFFRAFRRRVANGLLTGTANRRSKYVAAQVDPQHLSGRAAHWKSAVNVWVHDIVVGWAGKG